MTIKNADIKKYFSFDEFIETAKTPLSKKFLKDCEAGIYEKASQYKDPKWTGSDSFEHALEILENGFPEGVKKMKKELDNIEQAQAPLINQVFDVSGDEPSIDRFLSNDPENMISYDYIKQDGQKFVKVFYSYSYSYKKKPTQIIKRGARILSNIDNLENNGYRVKLVAYSSSNKKAGKKLNKEYFEVTIKDYQDHIELDRLAFIMAHPSMLRRFGFRLTEMFNPCMTKHAYGNADWLPEHAKTGKFIDINSITFDENEIDDLFQKITK